MSPERLQKVLASAGIASRRDCEALIAAGRVTVNGRVVTVPGTRVDLEHDQVLVDGKPLQMPTKRTYIMLHKPAGVVSTAEDTHGRPTVVDLVDVPARVFPVGRLDLDSEGLILLTDDGELAYALTHPSFEVEKEYRVLLDRPLTPEALRSWRNGVMLEGEMTAPAWVELLETTPEGVWARIVLREGRKRQIRAVAKLLGYNVLRLIRVREGTLELGDLPPRAWRYLTNEEIAALRAHITTRRVASERASGASDAPSPASPAAMRGPRPDRAPSMPQRDEARDWREGRPARERSEERTRREPAGRARPGNEARDWREGRPGRERSEERTRQNERNRTAQDHPERPQGGKGTRRSGKPTAHPPSRDSIRSGRTTSGAQAPQSRRHKNQE